MTMFVMTHKKFSYDLPENYQKLLVGAYNKEKLEGYLSDYEGSSISVKNPGYCELTGLYWIWKNRSDDYVGLSHYRRYFREQFKGLARLFPNLFKRKWKPIPYDTLLSEMDDYDWVIAKPLSFGDLDVYHQYKKVHHIKDLEKTERVIKKLYPEFIPAFKSVMKKNEISPFNMFFTSKKHMDEYCEWLFPILKELENEIDITDYEPYQTRVYGFISERLLNVWLTHYKNDFKVKKLPVFNLDEDFKKI